MKSKQLNLPDELYEQVQEIRTRQGLGSASDAIRLSISEYHRTLFPNYLKRIPQTPADKADRAVAVEEAKKKAKEEAFIKRGRTLCNSLAGTVSTKEDGSQVCIFMEYHYVNPTRIIGGETEIYFEHLNETMVDNQYRDFPKDMTTSERAKLCANYQEI